MELKNAAIEAPIITYLHQKGKINKVSVSSTFELTSRCNFRCKMCYVCDGNCAENKLKELTTEQWLEIANQAKQNGVIFLLITGGEPLLRDDFCELYEELSKMGFILSLNTNGSLITDKHIELFKKYPPNRINLSLYGTSNETYKEFCGVPAFDTVNRNILKLKEANIRFLINCSLTPRNACDYENIEKYCKDKDLILRAATYMFPSSRIKRTGERFTFEDAAKYNVLIEKNKLTEESFKQRTLAIINGVESIKERECPIEPEKNGIRCRAGKTSSWITWNGKMSFCGMVPPKDDNDVLMSGFNECWEKTILQASKVILPEKCINCKYKNACMACAASVFCESGKFDSVPEYICEMTKYSVEYYKNIAKEMGFYEKNR